MLKIPLTMSVMVLVLVLLRGSPLPSTLAAAIPSSQTLVVDVVGQDGPLGVNSQPASCSNITISVRNGTPPYTLTVSPDVPGSTNITFSPPYGPSSVLSPPRSISPGLGSVSVGSTTSTEPTDLPVPASRTIVTRGLSPLPRTTIPSSSSSPAVPSPSAIVSSTPTLRSSPLGSSTAQSRAVYSFNITLPLSPSTPFFLYLQDAARSSFALGPLVAGPSADLACLGSTNERSPIILAIDVDSIDLILVTLVTVVILHSFLLLLLVVLVVLVVFVISFAIVGAVLGSVLLGLVLGLVAIWIIRKARERRDDKSEPWLLDLTASPPPAPTPPTPPTPHTLPAALSADLPTGFPPFSPASPTAPIASSPIIPIVPTAPTAPTAGTSPTSPFSPTAHPPGRSPDAMLMPRSASSSSRSTNPPRPQLEIPTRAPHPQPERSTPSKPGSTSPDAGPGPYVLPSPTPVSPISPISSLVRSFPSPLPRVPSLRSVPSVPRRSISRSRSRDLSPAHMSVLRGDDPTAGILDETTTPTAASHAATAYPYHYPPVISRSSTYLTRRSPTTTSPTVNDSLPPPPASP
ncbi:hypothetical protein JCM24511_05493 [Saitozyma sp. JCM 24511]|nr:hypothetical protein JCM24511_05493 [Saitozyma sp. JCM 24511]